MYGYWNNGFNDMMNFGSRAGIWFLIYNAVKFIIIIVVIILLVRMLVKNSQNDRSSASNRAVETSSTYVCKKIN